MIHGVRLGWTSVLSVPAGLVVCEQAKPLPKATKHCSCGAVRCGALHARVGVCHLDVLNDFCAL